MLNNVKFMHARYRFEIEIPNDLTIDKEIAEDLVITSQRAGYTRYHTDKVKDYMERLEYQEDLQKDAVTPFVCAIF